ncbi:hypothetical protein [Persicirhabdus sediminis]|uniref:Uncharacterized protein n=1 Tax=Persicirhabdus sediminis TaxID=454144 RepID=A0A8J7SIM1_9BACT|nr:hypothetical protein [Persicirhabdus sediminis]MBK1790709.1 hypothetical protein [Persicirhabdus sediminis]
METSKKVDGKLASRSGHKLAVAAVALQGVHLLAVFATAFAIILSFNHLSGAADNSEADISPYIDFAFKAGGTGLMVGLLGSLIGFYVLWGKKNREPWFLKSSATLSFAWLLSCLPLALIQWGIFVRAKDNA